MPDNRFQGKKVSDSWDVILTEAAKYVRFRLNSGRRTMSEQWALFRQNMIRPGVPRPGHPLTAVPSPNAPHIRLGRENHSLDVDSYVGDGENALQRWLNHQGLVMVNDVSTESWHMTEASEARLKRVAARIAQAHRGKDEPTLRKGTVNREATRHLQRLLRAAGVKGVPLNGKYDLATRLGVKRFQRKHNIPTDAKATVGPKTWAALRRVVS